jgi:hypothetical protein
MIRRQHISVALLISVFAFGCSQGEGALTAQIIWPEGTQNDGVSKQELRAASVPPQVGRLQIVAIDGTDGSTLAETNLVSAPGAGEQQLNPAGGTWTLEDVEVGMNRTILARAFLGGTEPRANGLFIFEGSIPNIEVRPGELVNAGALRLQMRPGVRYPPLDFSAPDQPSPLTLMLVEDGEALWLSFTRPPQSDVGGYVIALSTLGTSVTPTIARGAPLEVGDTLLPGIRVVGRLWSDVPEVRTIEGLNNGQAYSVLVYAYDTDFEGLALNYSAPATAFAVPTDSKMPGLPGNLSVVPGSFPSTARITFLAPGEDDATGLPDRYEIRTATDVAALTDVASFEALPSIPPPVVEAPGEEVSTELSFELLRQSGRESFYVGVRAIDKSGNEGPIATAQLTLTATMPPAILELTPQIVIAGNEVTIRGRYLGESGSVTLTTTGTTADVWVLNQIRYTNDNVSVTVPLAAKSGTLAVTRAIDGATVSSFLVVVLKQIDAFEEYLPPYELVSAETLPGVPIAALYRERPVAADFEGAIERVVGLTPDPTPLVPLISADRSTAIGGTYDPISERFYFLAANAPNAMTLASVSTSTLTPLAERTNEVALAGGADRVSLAVLGAGPLGEVPAIIAFTVNGVIRTATVADLRTDVFPAFYALSSSTAQFDRVTIRATSSGEVYMAHRSVVQGVGELVLRRNATPQLTPDFLEVPATTRVRVGTRFELLAVPTNASDEEMVIVYEERNPQGATDVRLMRADDFGTTPGYAPFELVAAGRRLEDAGLVVRNGDVWIAILATRAVNEAQYTELPLDALLLGDSQRGLYRGVILDSITGMNSGRIGCKFEPVEACPIIWMGDNVRALFIRR